MQIKYLLSIKSFNRVFLGVLTGYPLYLFLPKKDAAAIPNACFRIAYGIRTRGDQIESLMA